MPPHRPDPRRWCTRGVALALVALLCGTSARSGQADEPKPEIGVEAAGRLLQTLVDLPTQGQRAAMAKRLAGRDSIRLATWLRAMRGFGTFEPRPVGNTTTAVKLRVGDESVPQLFTTYVPTSYAPDRPAPLLMVFHGTGGDGREDWRAWKQSADQLGMVVVCPGDPIAAEGFTATPRERDAAWAALRLARRSFNIDENRIFATGVSRGGHLVWDLATRRPDRFAAIAPLIGAPRLTPAAGQNNLRYLENLVGVPIRDLQGSQDDARMLHNLRYAFSKLTRYEALDAKLIEFPDRGHDFDFQAVDWTAWFKTIRRAPQPARVIRRFARAGEGRAFYVDVLEAGSKVKEIPRITADRRWSRMTDAEQRIYMAEFVEKRTARIECRMDTPGQFRIRATEVKRMRLLLTSDMLDEKGRVEVLWNGRRKRKPIRPDVLVLLTDFAERFDRSFLPIAALRLP